MRSRRLYLATRSLRAGAPVLICPALQATAMSAMEVSSVSPLRHPGGLQCLGQRADLVGFDEDGVGRAQGDAPAQALRVGDKEVVADNLNPPA